LKRLVFEPEHEQLRETARQFLEKECAPYTEKWESERLVDRESYVAAGKYGLIGFNMPEEYGGGGVDDFRFNAVIVEEFSKFGPATPGVSLQNDIVGPYFASLATDEQKQRWLPGYITGELIGAIAMTEPGAGSDLAGIKASAVRDGDDIDAFPGRPALCGGGEHPLVSRLVELFGAHQTHRGGRGGGRDEHGAQQRRLGFQVGRGDARATPVAVAHGTHRLGRLDQSSLQPLIEAGARIPHGALDLDLRRADAVGSPSPQRRDVYSHEAGYFAIGQELVRPHSRVTFAAPTATRNAPVFTALNDLRGSGGQHAPQRALVHL